MKLPPYQYGIIGNEITLVALMDDLCHKMDQGSATLLILLDLWVSSSEVSQNSAAGIVIQVVTFSLYIKPGAYI